MSVNNFGKVTLISTGVVLGADQALGYSDCLATDIAYNTNTGLVAALGQGGIRAAYAGDPPWDVGRETLCVIMPW